MPERQIQYPAAAALAAEIKAAVAGDADDLASRRLTGERHPR